MPTRHFSSGQGSSSKSKILRRRMTSHPFPTPKLTSQNISVRILSIFLCFSALAAAHTEIAVTSSGGATIEDCVYLITHEPRLNADHLAYSAPGRPFRNAVCKSRWGVQQCDNAAHGFTDGWYLYICVGAWDIDYDPGYEISFKKERLWNVPSKNGGYRFVNFDVNAGGQVSNGVTCFCDDVGGPSTC